MWCGVQMARRDTPSWSVGHCHAKYKFVGNAHLGVWHRRVHIHLQEFKRYCCPLPTLASSAFGFSMPVSLTFSNNPRLLTLQLSHEQPRHTSVPLAHVMLAYTLCAAHPDLQELSEYRPEINGLGRGLGTTMSVGEKKFTTLAHIC